MSPRSRAARDEATLLAALAVRETARRGSGARGASRARNAPRAGLLYWLPVLVALAVFAQLSLLGLRPALRESARLSQAEDALWGRYQAQEARSRRLDRLLRAQRDPIYLERERRMLLDPAGGLLAR